MSQLDEDNASLLGARGKRESGGAQIAQHDPRVTAAAQWVMNILQGLIVLVLAFVADNLYQVNLTLAADAVSKQEMSRQLAENRALDERQEEHINAVDRRVYTLEGRNLRGGPNGH